VPWGCADGLLFDDVNNWCNFPDQVDCGSRPGGGATTQMTTTPLPTTTTEIITTTTFNPDTIVSYLFLSLLTTHSRITEK
jgi:hypothetical protein